MSKTNIRAIKNSVGEFINKLRSIFTVTHKGIGATACRNIAVQIIIFTQKLSNSTFRYLAGRIVTALLLRAICRHLTPEALRVSQNLQFGELLKHFFKSGQACFVDHTVALEFTIHMNGNRHIQRFACCKQVLHARIICINVCCDLAYTLSAYRLIESKHLIQVGIRCVIPCSGVNITEPKEPVGVHNGHMLNYLAGENRHLTFCSRAGQQNTLFCSYFIIKINYLLISDEGTFSPINRRKIICIHCGQGVRMDVNFFDGFVAFHNKISLF